MSATITTPPPVKGRLFGLAGYKRTISRTIELYRHPVVKAGADFLEITGQQFAELLTNQDPKAFNALEALAKQGRIKLLENSNGYDFSLGNQGLNFSKDKVFVTA